MKTTNSAKKNSRKKVVKSNKNLRLVGGLAFFIVFAVVGISLLLFSHASGSDTLTLSPNSGTYSVGNTLTITINENSTDAINAVEADLTYNSTQLQFVSATCSSTFGLQASATGGSGSVKLACAIQNSTVTGSQTVGTVSFTVLSGSSSTIAFASTSSIVNQANDTNSWNGNTTGGTYTIATAPTVSITSPTGSAVVHSNCNPVAATASATTTGATISKVELFVNGTLYQTVTSSPYNFNWSTLSGYPNGTYSLTAEAFDSNGLTATTSAVSVKVDNGDVNSAGTVGIADLSILAANWDKSYGTTGSCDGSNTTFAEGDLNEDNTVNIADLSILASNWGVSD